MQNQQNQNEIVEIPNFPDQVVQENDLALVAQGQQRAGEALLIRENQSRIVTIADLLRPVQYNFVNDMIDKASIVVDRFGNRNTAGCLLTTAISILSVAFECSTLYPEAKANGMIATAENMEILQSYNRNRTEMRNGCIGEKLSFVVPSVISLSVLTLLAVQQFSALRARRLIREGTQIMPENLENQPRDPSLVADVVVLERPFGLDRV